MAEFILKDWYGKDRVFDKETIYVQGADGELMPFTHGTGNPVIEPLNVTQNGVYTTPVGVNGFSPVAVNVPSPEIKLQEKTITENGEYTADSGFDGLGKVMVEVAGSGGGSLPAGLYWEISAKYGSPSNYFQKWFMYNGELYVMALTTVAPGSTYNLYKYSDADEKWVTVVSSGYAKNFGDPYSKSFVEYNGKIHIFGGDFSDHHVFDGTSFSLLNKCPKSVHMGNVFVQGDKLKIYAHSNDTVYVWDENSDSWTSEGVITSSSSILDFFTHDGTTYFNNSGQLYKYENGVATSVAPMTGITLTYPTVLGNNVYCYKGVGKSTAGIKRTEWYAVDLKTYTGKLIGYGPAFSGWGCRIVLQNKLHLIFGNPNGLVNTAIMHEVTE